MRLRLARFAPSRLDSLTIWENHWTAIQQALAQAEGDKIEAARLLSIGKTTLYRKLRQYGDYKRRRRGPARRSA